MQYTLSRSNRRRTIGITIKHGQVRVAAPPNLAQSHIDDFLSSKQTWITRHLQAQREQLTALTLRRWQHGEMVFWLGQAMRLEIRDGHRNTITAIDNILSIRLSRQVKNRAQQVRYLVCQWFKQQGQLWLDQYVDLIGPQHPRPNTWRIANYTAKWAACSHTGELSFSWRLFAAPEWVVRYVVLHERCHLTHFNHSAQFWGLVENHDPYYRDAEHWLKTHGHTLLNDNVFNYVND